MKRCESSTGHMQCSECNFEAKQPSTQGALKISPYRFLITILNFGTLCISLRGWSVAPHRPIWTQIFCGSTAQINF